MQLKALHRFGVYRTPTAAQTDKDGNVIEPARSGPITWFEIGATIDDASDAEAKLWIDKGHVAAVVAEKPARRGAPAPAEPATE